MSNYFLNHLRVYSPLLAAGIIYWIKQYLRIKKFNGTSVNAAKGQIWTAVLVYFLVPIVKKRFNLNASLYTQLQIFSVALFDEIPSNKEFLDGNNRSENELISYPIEFI